MSKKTVVITGATKGLGRELTLAFAAAGHHVIGLFGSDDAAATALEVVLAASSWSATLIKYDVASDDAGLWQHEAIQHAEDLVLINNAYAPFVPRPFHLLGWEDFSAGLTVGLKGTWLASRAVLRPMLRVSRGTIVFVLSSALSGDAPKGFGAYVSTKHAQRGLMLALASEYAAKGIRVFSVSPGFMDTPFTASWDDRLSAAVRANSRVSDPSRAAERVVQLVAGDEAPGRGEDYEI